MSANKQHNNGEGTRQNRHTQPDSFAVHSSAAKSAHFDGEALMNSSESGHKHFWNSLTENCCLWSSCWLADMFDKALSSQRSQFTADNTSVIKRTGIRSQTFVDSAIRVKERPNGHKSVAFDVKLCTVWTWPKKLNSTATCNPPFQLLLDKLKGSFWMFPPHICWGYRHYSCEAYWNAKTSDWDAFISLYLVWLGPPSFHCEKKGGWRGEACELWELRFWNNKTPFCPNSFRAEKKRPCDPITSGKLQVQVWMYPRHIKDPSLSEQSSYGVQLAIFFC